MLGKTGMLLTTWVGTVSLVVYRRPCPEAYSHASSRNVNGAGAAEPALRADVDPAGRQPGPPGGGAHADLSLIHI
eukprot:1958210-Prymnesium_polylepis.1